MKSKFLDHHSMREMSLGGDPSLDYQQKEQFHNVFLIEMSWRSENLASIYIKSQKSKYFMYFSLHIGTELSKLWQEFYFIDSPDDVYDTYTKAWQIYFILIYVVVKFIVLMLCYTVDNNPSVSKQFSTLETVIVLIMVSICFGLSYHVISMEITFYIWCIQFTLHQLVYVV